jgi:hypothetical protein
VEDYGALFTQVGFSNVQALDKTSFFINILQKEMKKFAEQKDEFVKVGKISLLKSSGRHFYIANSIPRTFRNKITTTSWKVGRPKWNAAVPVTKHGASS